MLTGRGWWFLNLIGLVTLIGTVGVAWWSATVPILGLSLLVWFAFEWVLFTYRIRSSADRLVIHRVLVQGNRVVPAVWAGSRFTVRITIEAHGSARLPYVYVKDHFPADLKTKGTDNTQSFDLQPGTKAVLEYELDAPSPGIIRFEGLQVRFADLAGFFYLRRFLRDAVEFLVLPPLTDDEGRHRGYKRFNTLPPPGIHRLRRPGSGNELLDLREYQPGDPPKMIAWKPSAKRDMLITKEIESDVPVRCVLFLDASNGARIGPPGHSPVARMAEIAAGIAQAASSNRDLVGLNIFDEVTADITLPARTRIHTIQLLRKLGEAAARLPNPGESDAELLGRYAYPVAQLLYPDLLARDVNSLPFGLYWRPIADSRLLWVVLALLFCPTILIRPEAIEAVAKTAATVSSPEWNWTAKFAIVLGLIFFPPIIAGMIWIIHGLRGFFAPRSVRTTRRKQLGSVFAVLDGSGPATIERCLHDDGFFSERTTRFLLDHRIRLPLVLHDHEGNYRFGNPEKIEVLAGTILRSVSRARDNELYVILAHLLENTHDLAPLIKAATVARARHHQVLVLVPWPNDVPAPEPDDSSDEPNSSRKLKPLKLGSLVKEVLIARYHRAFQEMRFALARAGAHVVLVEDEDPIRLVLGRLDRLRGSRIRR